jgi:hypothetical protein
MKNKKEFKNLEYKIKKAQLSFEAVIVFLFIIIVLIILFSLIPQNLVLLFSLDEEKIAQESLEKIAQTSEQVYLIGDGGILYIDIKMPLQIDLSSSYIGSAPGINDWELKKELRIKLTNGKDIVQSTKYPICGTFPTKKGLNKIKIEYNSTQVPHIMVNSNC